MYLKRIEISGFKSFADPMSIDFKDGITCIIGPNGSGKSNISDAMRWVLGEQSAKTLRGGKMEEIIFAGSESRRSKGMVEVCIFFDNSDNLLPIDFAEVSIKRRLYKSGESEYFINNSQCRLRDIKELLTDTGIGVDGYSFIGQGRVDKMVSDKPETRREVFEEAAGIVKYKNKKDQAQRKLDSAQINLDRMSDIIGDIESRIGGLKEESEKASEAATLEKRHRELEIGITLDQMEKIDKKTDELANQINESSTSIEQIRGEKGSLEERISNYRKEIDLLIEKVSDTQASISENALESQRATSELTLADERDKHLGETKARLEEEINSQEIIIDTYGKQVADLNKKKDSCEGELRDLREKLLIKQGADEELKKKALGRQGEIDRLKNELFETASSINLKVAEQTRDSQLLGTYDSTIFKLGESIENENAELANANHSHGLAMQEIQGLIDKKQEIDGGIATKNEKRESINADIAGLVETDKQTSILIERHKARLRAIEDMEASYEGFGGGVKAVMRQGFSGIIGVVSELFTLPTGYELAIETALGPAMQHIVTKDDDIAKSAIRFLKENNAGRLTFLPISSISAPKLSAAEELENSKGFLGYASDIIDFENDYEDIFLFLIGRTIIVDDIDNAIAMNKKNRYGYRLVTLDGDVVNASGSLTGGRYKNKTASLLERRSEKSRLNEQISEAQRSRNAALEKYKALSKELDTLNEDLASIDEQQREIDAKIAEKRAGLANFDYIVQEINSKISSLEADLVRANKDKDEASEKSESLVDEIDVLIEKKAKIEEDIEELLDSKDEAEQTDKDNTDELLELKISVSEMDAELRGLENSVNEVLLRRQQAEIKLAEIKEELDELLHPKGEVHDRGELESLIGEHAEEKLELESNLEKYGNSLEELRQNLRESEHHQDAKNSALDSVKDSHTSMEIELGRLETRRDTLKEKLWDEFEMSIAQALEFKSDDFTITSATNENREIKNRLRELGEVNPLAIAEYKEVSERYEFLSEQRDDINQSIADYAKIVADMDKISKKQFQATFDAIATNFTEAFSSLFGGGKGEVSLADENEPLTTGIEINIRPPGKPGLASIDGYSGGERTMVAIALMFAILKAKPTPFCILDEVDAALDEVNIHRFANYLVNFQEIQFALVTHQRATMEYAHALFGVTMEEKGVTKILSLILGESEAKAFAEREL